LIDGKVILTSITIQNITVAICGVLLFILSFYSDSGTPFSGWIPGTLFVVLNIFGSIGALASMASSVSIDKDWAIVIAGDDAKQLAGRFQICKKS